ncbi:BTAD domain-containing putative transcriptional regulator [Streptomyces zhihengii]
MLHVRLLGPIDAVGARGRIDLGGAKPRALLAALALEPGRVVSATRLVDVVWCDNPPASARALIQTYVSTLRRAFAEAGHDGVIVTRAPGYALRSEAVSVDADRFARLLSRAGEAATAEDFAEAAALLREARALWHGPALSGVADPPLAGEARRLDEMRLSAAEQLYAAELAGGRLDHVAELTALVDAHPVNERLRGQLMVTLHRLGRRADALACFRTGRDALVGELGIEPGPELRELHRSILQPPDGPPPGEPDRTAGAANRQPPAHLPPPCRTSPAGKGNCVCWRRAWPPPLRSMSSPGREAAVSPSSPCTPPTRWRPASRRAAVQGTAGMTGSPATTGEVLGGFLRALGVPERRLPESDQARVELYRTLVAGRRLLIVLDDAANEQQVRPLLPAGSGCAALVTARDRLGGLAGARLTELGALVPDESMELLTTIVGADRVRAEPDAAARILAACDHLPLALRIAGARLAMRSRMPLATLAERLDDERRRLDELCAGDLAVRSTISLSFGTLSEQARTALGRLGHLGLPDFSAWVVGWLLELSDSGAQRVLDSLVDAQLVEFTGVDTTGTDRYRLHDLIRLFAREYAEKTEPAHVLRNTVEAPLHGWLALLRAVAATRPPAALIWQPSATVTVAKPPPSGPGASSPVSPTGWRRGARPRPHSNAPPNSDSTCWSARSSRRTPPSNWATAATGSGSGSPPRRRGRPTRRRAGHQGRHACRTRPPPLRPGPVRRGPRALRRGAQRLQDRARRAGPGRRTGRSGGRVPRTGPPRRGPALPRPGQHPGASPRQPARHRSRPPHPRLGPAGTRGLRGRQGRHRHSPVGLPGGGQQPRHRAGPAHRRAVPPGTRRLRGGAGRMCAGSGPLRRAR